MTRIFERSFNHFFGVFLRVIGGGYRSLALAVFWCCGLVGCIWCVLLCEPTRLIPEYDTATSLLANYTPRRLYAARTRWTHCGCVSQSRRGTEKGCKTFSHGFGLLPVFKVIALSFSTFETGLGGIYLPQKGRDQMNEFKKEGV